MNNSYTSIIGIVTATHNPQFFTKRGIFFVLDSPNSTTFVVNLRSFSSTYIYFIVIVLKI